MKKLLLYIATVALAIGCSNDFVEEPTLVEPQQDDAAETAFVTLNLAIEGCENDTRVSVTQGSEYTDPWTVAWEVGDVICVYSIDQADYKTLTYDGSGFSGEVYLGDNRIYYVGSDSLNTSTNWWSDNSSNCVGFNFSSPSTFDSGGVPYMISSNVITIEGDDDDSDGVVSNTLETTMKHVGAVVDFGMKFTNLASDLDLKLTYITLGGVPEGGSADEYVALETYYYTDPELGVTDDSFVSYVNTNYSVWDVSTDIAIESNDTEYSVQFAINPFTLESGKKLNVTLSFNGGLFYKNVAITNDSGSDFEFARATHSYLRNTYDMSDISSDGLWIYDKVAFADQSAGTAEDPIEIASEQELAYLSAVVKGMVDGVTAEDIHYKLTKDLDLSGKEWTPISGQGMWDGLNGSFDGDGHSISGLTIANYGVYQGLFGCVSGSVENLKLVDVDIQDGYYVGGVAGYAPASTAKITNCSVSGVVSGYMTVGGVCGSALWGVILTECSSSCIVTGSYSSGSTGGVVGVLQSSTMVDCYNSGSVSGKSATGGVVGYFTHYDTTGAYSMTGCYNTGNVFSDGEFGVAGGVVGTIRYGVMDSCYNTGNVAGVSDTGGVAGYISNYNKVSNCYNTGEVSYAAESSLADCAGGVAGSADWSNSIYNCYNTGTVLGCDYAGGVIGDTNSTIVACYNVGEVSATSGLYVGGVYGKINSNYYNECYYFVADASAFTGSGTSVASISELNEKVATMNSAATTAGYTGTISFTAGGSDTTLPYLGIGGGEPFTYGETGSGSGLEDLGDNGGVGGYDN